MKTTTLLPEVSDEQTLLLEQVLELGEFPFLLGEPVPKEFHTCVGLLLLLRHAVPLGLQSAQVIDCQGEFGLPQVGDQSRMLCSASGLTLKRLELAVDLSDHVPGPLKVAVHPGELADRTLPAFLVLEDAGGLLDQCAPVFGTGTQYLVELALADDRVRVATESHVVKQLVDVHQSAWSMVQEVLALPRPVHPARDGDLVELERQRPARVVQGDIDFGHADCLTCRGTSEDDVFHDLTTQGLGGLFSENPQYRVGDVGLAGPVRADDDGHTGFQQKGAFVSEGLEPLQCERSQVHTRLADLFARGGLPREERTFRTREMISHAAFAGSPCMSGITWAEAIPGHEKRHSFRPPS